MWDLDPYSFIQSASIVFPYWGINSFTDQIQKWSSPMDQGEMQKDLANERKNWNWTRSSLPIPYQFHPGSTTETCRYGAQ